MPERSKRGPKVPTHEDLYRAILYPSWWKEDRYPPLTTAAFAQNPFSADIASLTTPSRTLARFEEGSGLVAFSCGKARELGFDARQEQDERFPDNEAHANVYCNGARTPSRSMAKNLTQVCRIIEKPHFATPDDHP